MCVNKRDIQWFSENRKEQWETAVKIRDAINNDGGRHIPVVAPVKSGKREIKIITNILKKDNQEYVSPAD